MGGSSFGGARPRGSSSMFVDDDDDMDGSFSFGGMPGAMPGMNGQRAAGRKQPPRPDPQSGPSEITRPFKVALEDLYTGATKHLKIGRKLLDGTTEDKVLEIQVHPGWKSGTKVRFAKHGNEQPNGDAQDLVFVVEEKPHAVFTREGNDLVCRLKIPLVDALTTSTPRPKQTVQHLDGRRLQVAPPSGIIKPGQESTIPGEGMPIRKDGSVKKKGDLIVKWDVVFPTRLTPAQEEGIRKVLA